MTTRADADPATSAMRELWAAGDYHRFAKQTVWEVGPVLVSACGITAGQRVLDVACGTGNVALRAAQTGASVVACDLTPEHFEAGRREAAALEVELDWVVADAEALPFEDAEFDVVTSCFGVMFAPHHKRAADELLRVCKPGGTLGLASFTPDGLGGRFFTVVAAHAPAPPQDALPPVLWGSEEHVRALFADRVESLELTRQTYVERAASAAAYVELFQEAFGPIVTLRASLGESRAAFDSDLTEYATRENRGSPGGPAEYEYEYLLAVARKGDMPSAG